jgi:hypothetical protein
MRGWPASRQKQTAPGVGRDTDLIVINRDVPRFLTAASLAELDELFAESSADAEASLQEKTAGLRLEYEGNIK